MPVERDLFQKGASNSVKSLAIMPSDRVIIIGDKETNRIARAINVEAKKRTKNVLLTHLEHHGKRPFTSLPDALAEKIRSFKPTVSYYAASGQKGEFPFRKELLKFLSKELNVRHAHMIGVDETIMRTGMLSDPAKVHQITYAVHGIVKKARTMRVSTPAGTNLLVELNPKKFRWAASSPLILESGHWSNLPNGETFTHPENVNGTIVVDGVLGDYLAKLGSIHKTPLTINIKNSRIVSFSSKSKKVETAFREYLEQDKKEGNRVGEFAVGTNIFLKEFIGNLLQDEKFPGIHMAFGDPLGEHTGATHYTAKTHIDVVPRNPTIEVDGKLIMKNGKFTEKIYNLAKRVKVPKF